MKKKVYLSSAPIYKFVIKLQQYNVITSTYYNTVNKYIGKKNKTIKNKSNILLTDTTLISNKLGIDNIGYNPLSCIDIILRHMSYKTI